MEAYRKKSCLWERFCEGNTSLLTSVSALSTTGKNQVCSYECFWLCLGNVRLCTCPLSTGGNDLEDLRSSGPSKPCCTRTRASMLQHVYSAVFV